MDVIALHSGTIVQVHEADWCVAPCAVHSPSNHPLKLATLEWSNTLLVFFRRCDHGIHHPDPDSLTFMSSPLATRYETTVAAALVLSHPSKCDGCCVA